MTSSSATSRIAFAAALLLSSLVACGGDDSGSTTDVQTSGGKSGAQAGAGAGGAGAGGARAGSGVAGMTGAAGATDDGAPTWTGIYTYTFRTCRVDVCHGGGLIGVSLATQQGGYDSLVGQPANATSKCSMLGKMRVVPGDPDNSLLYLKLDINAPCGQQMPPGGQLPMKQIQRVRDWIAMGAKND